MPKLTYLGHSTVIIESNNGKQIIIDPFLEGNPLCPDELKNPGKIDHILLTHGHADHASSAVPLAKEQDTTIAATYELAMLVIKEGVEGEKVQPMNKGGTVSLANSENIKVTLTDAFHSSSYDSADGNTYYAGEACGIVLKLESGVSIYHAGDTSLFSDMKLIGENYKPDIALLPIGDCFTMGPKDASKAAKLIGAKTIIPIHHSTFPLLTGTPEQFLEEMKQVDAEVKVLAPGESLAFG